GQPINLLTVGEKIMKEMKRKPKLVDKLQWGPSYLVDLMKQAEESRTFDAEDIEYLARQIMNAAIQREIINSCNEAIARVYAEDDVTEISERLNTKLAASNPVEYFRVRSFNEAMADAAKEPPIKRLCSSFLSSNDLALMFAPPGVGKSIFAIQMGEAISAGVSALRENDEKDILLNETDGGKVLYFDFEMRDKELEMRYEDRDTGRKYVFHENFKRIDVNDLFEDVTEGMDVTKYILRKIEMIVKREQPIAIIIDNITTMTAENISDPDTGRKIVTFLDKKIRKRYGIGVLMIAHTTKVYNKQMPLDKSSLGGAAAFERVATTIWGIGQSYTDKNEFYLKQLKTRNGEKEFDSDKVIVVRKHKRDNLFLSFYFVRFDEESNLLLAGFEAEAEHPDGLSTEEALYEKALFLKAKGKSWSKIKDELQYRFTSKTLNTNAINFAMENEQRDKWLITADGRVIIKGGVPTEENIPEWWGKGKEIVPGTPRGDNEGDIF
ncbi:MAG: hypothetical protein RLZZ292_2292, partial [Bacteroidota bacterium]